MARRGPSDLLKRVVGFDLKTNGTNYAAVVTVRRDRMVAQQNQMAVVQYALERNFKAWFAGAGLDTILQANYMAFAKAVWRQIRKHVGQTQIDAVTQLVDLFEDRLLVRAQLIACVLACFNLVVV